MNAPLLIAMPGGLEFARSLAEVMRTEALPLDLHTFPDGETSLRFDFAVDGRSVAIVAMMDRPNGKTLPLLFAAKTARELGAGSVGLISPYLPYMRQDKRFHAGEAVTSELFAGLISEAFDWMATVDPHLHRWHSLSEVYSIPTSVAHAAPLLSDWIRTSVERPVLIGPDSESEQWVAAVANDVGCDHIVLEKHRSGDRDVAVSIPSPEKLAGHTPVIVDDIASTARTLIETVRRFRESETTHPVCVVIHGIFADNAYRELLEAGAGKVVSTNTVLHQSNAIDVTKTVAKAVGNLMSNTEPEPQNE